MYKLTNSTIVIRLSDGSSIPDDPLNRDRQEYNAWLKLGNTPEPIPEPTLDEQAAVINAKYQPNLDNYLNLILKAMGADGAIQQSRIIDYSTKYKALLLQKNAELEALENV